jgi:uncharacterized membrane protein
MLDVTAEIEIRASPADIAAVMFDPHRDPDWMAAVDMVEVMDPGIKPGARVRRAGTLLGKDVSWTTEVVAFHFPHVLELRIADGPFVGSVVYQVGRSAGGSVARIQNVGEVSAMGLPAAMIAGPMRAALAADLERLKAIVEQAAAGSR